MTDPEHAGESVPNPSDPDDALFSDPDAFVRRGGYVCVHGYRLLTPGDCVHPDCPPRDSSGGGAR